MASAIIVAAGMGIRMKNTVRKQYLFLADQPILVHTLRVFQHCSTIEHIFLVVPQDDLEICQTSIVAPLMSKKPMTLITGGATRQKSVYNGLKAVLNREDIVLIHDGVRPFIRQEHITVCVARAKEIGACILGLPVADTLKRLDEDQTVINTIDRKNIWQAQTPQAFRYEIIRRAHEQAHNDQAAATDDSLLVEQLGFSVKVIKGSVNNIKITTPEDLAFAKILLKAEVLVR